MYDFTAFSDVLADFGKMNGQSLALDETGACVFTVDAELVVNLQTLAASGYVLAWATVGGLPDDGFAGARAAFLLSMQDLGRETHGFSLGMDEEDRRLVIHDRRPSDLFASVDELAAWIDDLVETVAHIRNEFNARYPDEDLDELDDDETEIELVGGGNGKEAGDDRL